MALLRVIYRTYPHSFYLPALSVLIRISICRISDAQTRDFADEIAATATATPSKMRKLFGLCFWVVIYVVLVWVIQHLHAQSEVEEERQQQQNERWLQYLMKHIAITQQELNQDQLRSTIPPLSARKSSTFSAASFTYTPTPPASPRRRPSCDATPTTSTTPTTPRIKV